MAAVYVVADKGLQGGRVAVMPATRQAPVVYRGLYQVVSTIASWLTRKHGSGAEHIPAEGAALVVCNHTSNYDAIVLGDYVISHGRWPRFLGKQEIWQVPVVGWLAEQCRQIPVARHTARAKDALVHAREALEAGDLIAMFPEGTITRDTRGWPMRARYGAARLALATGVPVLPAAVLGAEQLLGGVHLELRKLWGRRKRYVHIAIGEPIDLSDLQRSDDPSVEQLAEASQRIMQAIDALYSELRGQPVPQTVWDQWQGVYVPRPQ